MMAGVKGVIFEKLLGKAYPALPNADTFCGSGKRVEDCGENDE